MSARRDIALNIIANAQDFQKEIAKIPGYTDKSAATAAMRLSTQMEKGFKKTEQQAKKSGMAIGGVLTSAAGNMLANLGTMAVSAIGNLPAVFAQITTEAADFTNQINDMAMATGMANDTLLGLDLLARASGQQLEQMRPGLAGFAKRMKDTSLETGEAKQAFKDLGIEMTEFEGGPLRDANEVFIETIDKLAGMEDATARTDAAVRILGESGGNLIVAMNSMGMSLSESAEMMRSFGLGTTEASEAAADFQRMKAVFESFSMGMKVAFMENIIPVVISLEGAISSAIGMVGLMIAEYIRKTVIFGSILSDLARLQLPDFNKAAQRGAEAFEAIAEFSTDAAIGMKGALEAIDGLRQKLQGPAGLNETLEGTAEAASEAELSIVQFAKGLHEGASSVDSIDGVVIRFADGVSGATSEVRTLGEQWAATHATMSSAVLDAIDQNQNLLTTANHVTGAITAGYEAEIEAITNVSEHRKKKIDQRMNEIQKLKEEQEGASDEEKARIQEEINGLRMKNQRIRANNRERQADIRKMWKGQKSARIAEAVMNQSVAISRAFAELGPVLGPIAATALTATLGFEIKRIRNQKAPTFHSGFFGGGAPDEGPAMLRRGESVLTQGATDSLGRDGVEALNQGRGMSSVFNFHIGGRLVESLVVDALSGGSAQRTLRPGGIAVGMVNPYVGR